MKMVSVLMPCFNSENYIYDAIKSILDQTFRDFELLVLDDCSTDETVSIVKSFDDERIVLLESDQNRGIVFQLNKGLEFSRGKYIARMDSDDISLPNRLQKQVDFLERKNNRYIDVLGTDAVSFGKVENPIIHKNYRSEQISFILNFKCALLHPTVMFRKSLFYLGYKYPEGYLYAEDFAFWKLVDKGNNIAILDEVLLKYRIHNNQTISSSKRFQKQRESCIRCLEIRKKKGCFAFLDRFMLYSQNKSMFYIDKWFGIENDFKIDIFSKIYIRFRKKQLSIKYEILNKIVN